MSRNPTAVAVKGNWLLTTPLGMNFVAMTFQVASSKDVAPKTEDCHQANTIHWDAHFCSMFLLPESDNVLLNDWGACTLSSSLQFVWGCPEPCCHPELVQTLEVAPKAKHDLCSLVLSAANLLLPGLLNAGRLTMSASAVGVAKLVDYDGVWWGFEEVGFN